MVAVAEPAFKVWSSLAVVAGGMIRVWAIARTAEDALPMLLERSSRFAGGGELFAEPTVYCRATKADMGQWGLAVDERWSVSEIVAITSNEIRYFATGEDIRNIKLDRLGLNLLRLHRQTLNA